MFMCWAVLSFTETSWLKALAAGCPNTFEMVLVEEDKLHDKTRLRETIFKTNVCHSAVQAAHYCCVCVFALVCVACVSWIVWWEEVSCHSIHAAKVEARAADSKGGAPIQPFLSLLHVVQRYLSRKLLWMPVWCHILFPWVHAFQCLSASRAKEPVSMAIRLPSSLLASFMKSRPGVSPCCALSGERLLCGNFVCSL